MKRKLLVAMIAMGALAIASAPLPYRCTITFLLEPVIAKPLVASGSDPICQVYDEHSNYSFMTLCEMLDSSEMRQKIHDPTARMEELAGTDLKLLISEASTPHEAEKSVLRTCRIFEDLVGNFHKLGIKTELVLPWWRPMAALGLLALFSILMRFGRRESHS